MTSSNETTRVHIFAPKWFIEKIDEQAANEGSSRSEVVRKSCASYLLNGSLAKELLDDSDMLAELKQVQEGR